MEKLVRVGMMPGRISEYAVTVGMNVVEVLELANFNELTGYDVKVDGVKVDPEEAVIDEATSLILLAKQVKGN